MCDICDGMSHEESNQRTMQVIEQYGWSIVGVEGPAGVGWAYTIGLLEGFDHPELVVVGLDWPDCGALLNGLGDQVAAGRLLYPGLEDPDDGLEFGVVAPDQWKAQSTFAGWRQSPTQAIASTSMRYSGRDSGPTWKVERAGKGSAKRCR